MPTARSGRNGGLDMSFDPVSYAMGAKTGGGGGGGVTVEPLSVTENGTHQETGKAYSPVTVDVFQVQTYATMLRGLFSTQSTMSPIPTNVPKNIVIDAPNCQSIYEICSQESFSESESLGIESITLKLYQPVIGRLAFNRNYSIKTINFPNGITLKGEIASFLYQSNVEEIIGTIDLTAGMSAVSNAFTDAHLKTISFARNCIDFSTRFNSADLTDDSLVSIANALSDSASGLSLTHNTTAKTRCDQIVGTVTDGVFTADAGGSTTLTDFITNTKGWTLAS